MLSLFIGIPLIAAIITSLMGMLKKRYTEYYAIAISLINTVLSIQVLFLTLSSGAIINRIGGWEDILGIPIAIFLIADGLSGVLLLIINLIVLLASIFSLKYIKDNNLKNKYYSLLLLILAGLSGVVLSGDIFNLYIFLELTLISAYTLVAYDLSKEGLEASFKYQVFGRLGSAFILLGMIFLYFSTGTLNFIDLSRLNIPTHISNMATILFMVGFGIEAGLFSLHMWLPDAHQNAPAPISAILSGILIKIVGIYPIFRIIYNIIGITPEVSNLFLIIGNVSMMVAVLLAINQWDFKRLLAYHTISQMGYVFAAFGLNTPLGYFAGLLHLINHSLFKSLLFLNAGSIEYAIGTRNLKRLGNLKQKMPWTYFTNLVGSLSISGIPPLNGFWSKLLIIIASIYSGNYLTAIIATLVSILTLASFTKTLKYAFWGEASPDINLNEITEVPMSMILPMLLLSLLCVLSSLILLNGVSIYFNEIIHNTFLLGRKWSEFILPR